MKQLIIFSLSCLSSTILSAQAPPTTLIEELYTTRDADTFLEVMEDAKQAQLPPQALLEAQFLYFVDLRDFTSLASLAPALQQTGFSADDSEIFTLEDDWIAITKYCQALQALQNQEYDNFKKLITDAFWYSPRQASVFAQHIEELKLTQAMSKLTLDSTLELPNLLDNKTTSLTDKNKGATLLYFWSPWSREFDETLEDFKLTNTQALKHNFNIISLLAEQSDEVETDAETFITEHQISKLSNWVKDTESLTLSRALRIQSIPTLVLINKGGKVLFNGHPSNPQLWEVISHIAPDFKQPSFK